jgi:peptide/nickel transport system permease protein
MRAAQITITRVLTMVPLLLVVSLLVFVLVRGIPGDPVGSVLGLQATPELMERVRHELGLDRPIPEQYLMWLGQALRGDLGTDYRAHQPIAEIIGQRIPVSVELVALAMLCSLGISLPLAILASMHPGGRLDQLAMGVNLLGITMPDFWIGMLLILLVSLRLNLLPASGYVPISQGLIDNVRHMLLPAFTLSVASAAVQIRMVRSAMLDVLNKDYIKFARAKGLPESIVIVKHAMRSASPTIVTVIGMQTGYNIGQAIVVEKLFVLPGLGKLTADAVFYRNYPLVVASVLVLAFMFMMINLVTDVVYAYLNPQVE